MRTLTVSACRRPLYTSLVLSALAKCDGIREYHVKINVDAPVGSDACEAIQRVISPFREGVGKRWIVSITDGIGCNRAIAACLNYGFDHSDFHVHLEDDTLPARDFLRYMEWAGENFADQRAVFSASAYAKKAGPWAKAVLRRGFCPWGWGTWRNRWEEARPQLDLSSGLTWDCQMERIRGDRFEIAPALGRTQNIGQHGGAHNTPDFWAIDQFNPIWKETVCPSFFCEEFVYAGAEEPQ